MFLDGGDAVIYVPDSKVSPLTYFLPPGVMRAYRESKEGTLAEN